jgi:hypothetical protein
MSLLKYLNQNITENTQKSNYIDYSHIIGELKKQDKIDLLEYSYLNNLIKEPFLININWLFDILNKNTNDDEKIKITNSFPKLMQDKLKVNKNIYNDLINNKYLTFSNNQQKALKKLIKFLVDYKQKTFGLYGYAGTGKTTTLVEFVAYLLENKFIKSVALSAPTNKAVNIIKSKFRHHLKRLARIEYDLSFDDLVAALEKRGLKVDFITIHKLLNYKNDFDNEGDKVFLRNGKTNLNDYDLVIIDECSMIPYMIINNIYDDIREIVSKSGNNYQKFPKILFSGDICQLPPVNEQKSIIFLNIFEGIKLKSIISFPELKKYYENNETKSQFKVEFTEELYEQIIVNLEKDLLNMKHFTLTEVVRSKLTNVVNLCYNIREWIDNLVKQPRIKDYIGQGVYIYKNTDPKNKTNNDWFKKYMAYHESKKHPSNIILAWTNRQCDIYNDSIRKIIFKDKTSINKYEVGDILILNDFYILDEIKEKNKKDNSNRFYTSEQIKITDLEIIIKKCNSFSDCLPKQLARLKNIEKLETKFKQYINKINNLSKREYKCWKIYVKKLQDLDIQEDDTHQLYVLHDESQKVLENDKIKILNEIRKLKWELEKNPDYSKTVEKYILKQLWKEWSKIYTEPFANVNLGCSISCHKSQSSTYFNVFVDADDILNNNNNDEAKRCIYTALTRASNEIHILI